MIMKDEPQDAYLPDSDLETLQPFDVREQSSNKGMVMLLGGFLFLLALAFVMLKLFSSGTRDRDQTPRILAENEPYKEVPLERGGDETPNQDKQIYEVLNGTATEGTVSIAPTAEAPVELPPVEEIVPSKPAANIVIKQPEEKPAAATPVTRPKAEPIVTAPSQPAPRPVSSGDYVVQIASLRSLAEAETLWGRLSTKYSGVLNSSHNSDIKRVDLDEKGIYYRLRVAGFSDKDGASALCSQLKSRNQDCIVTKR
jgi:cell division protein FtsN